MSDPLSAAEESEIRSGFSDFDHGQLVRIVPRLLATLDVERARLLDLRDAISAESSSPEHSAEIARETRYRLAAVLEIVSKPPAK